MTEVMKKETRKYTSTRVMLPTDIDHDYSFSLRYIKEAQAAGVEFGTIKFLIYDKHRWFEDCGKMKSGINVAGYKKMGSYYGFSEETVRHAYTELQKDGLMRLVATDGDEKIFRNKTKVWVSTARLTNVRCAAEFVELITYRGRGHTKPVKCLTGEMVEKSNRNDFKSNRNDFVPEEPPLSEVPIEVPSISKDIESKDRARKEYGNPLVNRAFEIWEQIMGYKLESVGKERQYAYAIMRNKSKGEKWLSDKLRALRQAQLDPEFKYSGVKIRTFKELHYNSSKLEGWLNEKKAITERQSLEQNNPTKTVSEDRLHINQNDFF